MTANESQEETTEELENRLAELRRLMEDTDEALQSMMRPSSAAASGGNEKLMDLEAHVAEVEEEMKSIQQKLPVVRQRRRRPKLPGNLRMRKKKPPVEQFPLHNSPNTVQTVIDLQRRCEDRLGGEAVEMVWALVFKMPEQKDGAVEDEDDGEPEPEPEDEDDLDDLDDLEEELGYDLDGDGEVGSEKRKVEQKSGSLRISHEAWVACERIIESDLALRHVIPIDQRFLVRGVFAVSRLPLRPRVMRPALLFGHWKRAFKPALRTQAHDHAVYHDVLQIVAIGAPHHVLVEEAATTKLLMRLQESKGSMEFHPDLMQYYASNHGGLNEYRNLVWKRREGQDLVTHFKADEDLTDEELAARKANYKRVFTSALAQRLVMSRLKRKAKYNPIDQMSLATKGGGKNVDTRVLGHVKNRTGLGDKNGNRNSQASRHT